MKDHRSWLVSPWHDLKLVHAVQHPLVVPNLQRLEGPRSYQGQTLFDLKGIVPVDRPSTDRIEVRGSWAEWVDRLDEPVGPRVVNGA